MEDKQHDDRFASGGSMDPTAEQEAAIRAEAERLMRYDRDTLNDATALAEEVQAAKGLMLELKGKHDSQKKIYTGLSEELGQYMRTRKNSRHARPIRQMTIDEVIASTDHAESAPADDAWKTVPLTALVKYGLKDKDVQLLTGGVLKGGKPACPVVNLGDLAAFATPYPNNPDFTRNISDIEGLGQAAVDRLAQANEDFWKAWGHHLQAEMADPAGRQDTEFWRLWNAANPGRQANAHPSEPRVAGQDPGHVNVGLPAPEPIDLARLADDGGPAEPFAAVVTDLVTGALVGDAEPAPVDAHEEGPFFNKFSAPKGSSERGEWPATGGGFGDADLHPAVRPGGDVAPHQGDH